MLKHNNILRVLCLLLTMQGVFAQQIPSVNEVLDKAMEVYTSRDQYEVQLTYTLLRDKSNPVIIDSYKGLLASKGKNSYLKINTTEFISTPKASIKVNHTEKAMFYTASTRQGTTLMNPGQIASFLSQFPTKTIREEGNFWICNLEAAKLTQLPYGAIELYISKEDYVVKKQLMTLVNPGSIKDEKGKLSKDLKYLMIAMDHISTTLLDPSCFDTQKYIQIQHKKVALAPQYAHYTLINPRTK